jgi:hypothetical protein
VCKFRPKSADAGFKTVITPASEMENLKQDMESKDIPCGIGIGISYGRNGRPHTVLGRSRTELAKSMKTTLWNAIKNNSEKS